jgi:small nuclear ribonucleoprotein (snRNP)-like protein
MNIIKYLQSRINKPTIIETKKFGKIEGSIIEIDKKMNITIENAKIKGRNIKKLKILGSQLRGFEI